MNDPNFFIIGAPKAGTTSLYRYLCDHPNVFMSELKGPHYFATELVESRLVKTKKEYLNLFKFAKKNHFAVGEASVLYLYSKKAIENLYKTYPNSKLIILLRNPLEIVQSWHAEKVWSRVENTEDIELAWEMARNRNKNNQKLKNIENRILDYHKIAMFGDQIKFLLNNFSKEQIKIVMFDEFIKSTKDNYDDIINFLNLPYHDKRVFYISNSYKRFRVKWVQDFLTHPPKFLKSASKTIKNIFGIKRLNIIPKILQLNTSNPSKPELSPEFKNLVIDNYYKDVKQLSKLLKKDLVKLWFSK